MNQNKPAEANSISRNNNRQNGHSESAMDTSTSPKRITLAGQSLMDAVKQVVTELPDLKPTLRAQATDSLSSPAVDELDDWRLTLQRLSSDSSAWQDSDLYHQRENDVVLRRAEFHNNKDQVSLEELKSDLLQHEQVLVHAEAEDQQLVNKTADVMSLDEIQDELSTLVSDLTEDQEQKEQQVDDVTKQTKRLTITKSLMANAVQQMLTELKPEDRIVTDAGGEHQHKG